MRKSSRSDKKLLFVGNSFTARNDLPGMIAGLVSDSGISVDHQLISRGGASLRMHWNTGAAKAAIVGGAFDYVVLQEQSTLPIKNAARMRENIILFDAAIRDSGAKTVLYMTWARKHTPEKQKDITDAYESVAKELGAIVVPVGRAWQRFMAKHESPVLHDKDQSHPTLAGSYLAACVFVETLFGPKLLDPDHAPPGLSVQDVKLLQAAATV
jgi:hypothetical protein